MIPPFIASLIAAFFSGAFLCNCIPHLAAGLQGRRFPTPVARFRRKADSSAFANFLWGTVNIATGATLLAHHPLTIGLNVTFGLFAIGWWLLGAFLSRHFARRLGEPA